MSETTEKNAGSNLTSVAEYSPTAAALAELRQKHQGVVYDVAQPRQMKLAKEARAEIRTYRTDLEKLRKEIKAPALERCRLIDAEAKRITEELVALEEPIDVQIKAEEARKQAEELERLEAERLRVERIRNRIIEIRGYPATLTGKPAPILRAKLAALESEELSEDDFAEHYDEARDAHIAATATVRQMLDAAVAHEAEQKRIAAEREELDRMRAENERLQREAEERRRADEAKAAAERAEAERKAQAERDREAAEQRAREEAERAERQRQEEEARAAREAQERAEREAREAELAAERERQADEQKRLDEERARLERERRDAEAKAERERLANLGLREAAQAVVQFAADHLLEDEPVFVDLRAALANDDAKSEPARGKRAAA